MGVGASGLSLVFLEGGMWGHRGQGRTHEVGRTVPAVASLSRSRWDGPGWIWRQ